ncbi:MAG: hypothetical protein ABJ360_16250 [Roseobacter sp.]|uniref:hypothetical protein n=1 Tax=Roseibium sp. TaxID=1936156 RepID=UPI003266F7E3
MVELKKTLDTLEAFNQAIEGLRHLPPETLSKFLLAHYAVDLDLMSEFLMNSTTTEHELPLAAPAIRHAA